ncbi:MAG: YaiI/YqxD family protein [Parvibaculum sp.]
MKIYVDADACPVKSEVERVAERHNLKVILVSNSGMRPRRHPLIEQIVVPEGPDVADDWIAENIAEGDIAITADIPLASRCLEKKARVVSPTGNPFTEDNIGMALGMRELKQQVRESTQSQTYNAGFTDKDRSRFLGTLENEIQALKRLSGH